MTEEDIVEIGARAMFAAWTDAQYHDPHATPPTWESWHGILRDEWRASFQASLAALHTEGLVLVPAEPTEAMLRYAQHNCDIATTVQMASIYRAMLAAAQREEGLRELQRLGQEADATPPKGESHE